MADDIKLQSKPGAMVHAYNPSTQEVDAGGLRVQGPPGTYGSCL
jgi:hypothetical protein